MARTGSLISDSQTRAFTEQIARMEADIAMLKRAIRSSQLADSSIEDGALNVYDQDGLLKGRVGVLDDGTFGQEAINAVPPPRPNLPELVPFPAGIGVNWNGTFVADRPKDFKAIEVYRLATANGIPGTSNFIGTLNEAGGIPDAPLAYNNTYYYVFIAINTAEKEVGTGARATASEPSLVASAQPAMVVAQAVLDGIVNRLSIADGEVTRAKVATAAIDGTKIADNSITSPLIVAGSILGTDIAANTINAANMTADSITARELAALSVTADAMAANSVTAGSIAAGVVTAQKLATDLLLANQRIVVGSLTGNRVQFSTTAGLEGYSNNGASRTFFINSSTGAAFLAGEIATALSGSRIVANPGGNQPDVMRFYQGNVYGEIFADPAPNSTAGIFMAASGSNRGKLGAYPGEAFTSWTNSSGVSQSAFSCISDSALVWGGNVNLEGQGRWGPGIVSVTHRNSGGGLVGSRTLQFVGAGSGEGTIYAPAFDTQLVWTSGGLVIQNRAGTVGKQIVASNVGASSVTTKKNVGPITLPPGRTWMDLIELLEPKAWNYKDEYVEGETPPPAKTVTIPGDVVRDESGRIVFHPGTRTPLRHADQVIHVESPPPAKRHWGLIAEELQQYLPGLVQNIPDSMGGLGISDRDMIALLWLAVRQIARVLVNRGMAPPPKP